MRSILFFAALVFLSAAAAAQQLSININIQPVWGPVGYDHVEYYYLPDIDAFYYVPRHQFIYEEGGHWRRATSLPPRYREFDLYRSHKVVVNERTPYLHAAVYRQRYGSFRGAHDQVAIRDSHEPRYFVNKDHPEHARWVEEQKRGPAEHGKGRGNHGKGNGAPDRGRGKDHDRNP
ncbi:MAG TPA: hypothetical protein VMF59_14605 [Bacteroidota bacterium]|nr:hypothetical protein [Bacteroidota bacterium]